jgi:predicted AAA+ superfamily ATPase
VLTGSNATALTEAGGALAGRRGGGKRLDRSLLPMGFRTFAQTILGAGAPDAPALPVGDLHSPSASDAYHGALPWLDPLVEVWELYLLYGGFPRSVAAARAGHPIPAAFVDDLFNVVSADAFKASRLASVTEMALLERLWSMIASPANLSSVAQDIGTSHDIVARHVGYLRDAFLLWRCPQRADAGWLPRDRAQDKLYAIDPLIARLSHLRNPARPDIDPTALTEMQIGLALRRRVLAERPDAGNDEFLFHVRTPTRKEIDFVAEDLGSVAIEGKYVEGGNWRSEAATVTASSWDGILVTRNVLETAPGSSASAVPAGILGFLLDT